MSSCRSTRTTPSQPRTGRLHSSTERCRRSSCRRAAAGRPRCLRAADRQTALPATAGRIDDGAGPRLHVFDVGDAVASDAEVPIRSDPHSSSGSPSNAARPCPTCARRGRGPAGSPRQRAGRVATSTPHRLWPLSAVLNGVLDGETVFLKAVFPLFHHEPAITEALAREHPGAVPDVLRVDHERGWMLMRELRAEIAESVTASLAPALREHARIQRSWSLRTDELLALGAQDRAQDWPDLGLPVSLAHGDLHGANVVVDNGRATIFDWSDACVAHPLIDLHTFLAFGVAEADRDAFVDAYAEGWNVPPALVRSASSRSPSTRACTRPRATAQSPQGSSPPSARCSSTRSGSGWSALPPRAREGVPARIRRASSRAPPRCGAAGCTSRRGRSARARPS